MIICPNKFKHFDPEFDCRPSEQGFHVSLKVMREEFTEEYIFAIIANHLDKYHPECYMDLDVVETV